MSLLSRARGKVQDLGGGEGDPLSAVEDVETCWRCGVRRCDVDDGEGLCCECWDSISESERESLGIGWRVG